MFSKTGDLVIVCTGSAMPKVLDRDGFDVAECLKGDQYFNDLSKTYGHVSIVTDAVWHPNKKNLFITASADSTVRVWNTDTTQLNNTLKVRARRCAFAHCGSLRTFDTFLLRFSLRFVENVDPKKESGRPCQPSQLVLMAS